MEDNSLELVVQYAYDAWGNMQILQDSNSIATINPFRYRSYYFDDETKFYYLQTRYYDPELGRFINADSIEYLDPETLGGLNLYAYCGNNPVMKVDDTGTKAKWWEFWKWDWQAIGAALLVGLVATACIFLAGVTGGIGGIILASVGFGVAFGGVMGGLSAYQNGTNIAAGILGGAIKGAATGLAFGLGIATGAGALSLIGGFAALTVSVSANFLAGVAAYAVENSFNGLEINMEDAIQNGEMQALSGLFSFGTGVLLGIAGCYNFPKANAGNGLLSMFGTEMWSTQWLVNIIGTQLVKLVGYYPFNWVFQKYKKK